MVAWVRCTALAARPMKTLRNPMSRQTYVPANIAVRDIASLSSVASLSLEGARWHRGKSWSTYQLSQDETFSLVALQSYSHNEDLYTFTRLEGHAKVSFWLSGKHVTVLDGYGEHVHDAPEVFVTAGPQRMLKVDVFPRNAHIACVALCVLPEFFSRFLGLSPAEVPIPLRRAAQAGCEDYFFYRCRLTPDVALAARAILAAPFAVRRQAAYARAKSVELMCLLINQLAARGAPDDDALVRRYAGRFYEARELIDGRFGSSLTVAEISSAVGLNRVTLTSGFRAAFGLSLSDYLRKVRMEHAYELLQGSAVSVGNVANAVGYSHACNFSTAFQHYFGCCPRAVLAGRRERKRRDR